MSSAEDRTSSTVLPSQGASNSAPEEFRVEAHQDDRNQPGSSAPSADGPSSNVLGANDSPEIAPEDPGEDATPPLKTKPLSKVNAVAREIPVKVTGARAGGASEERDLFAESTTTVLVLEKGAILRLTAAVTPRQLLFLTNEESKREVVTQVIRKRVHRPTECYVELEFTEPVPGFWGLEFSAATALLPKDAKVIAAAELISSAETTEDELEEAAPPPSAAEVEALKREVEALRSQLNLLQTQPEPAKNESADTIPYAPPAEPAEAPAPPQAEPPRYESEKVAWAEITADAFPEESVPKPVRTSTPDPVALQKPALVFRKSLPPRKRSFRARGQFTPGFRAGMLRLAILSSILAALVGTAWYKGWLPGIHQPKKISVSSLPGGVTTPVAAPPLPSSVSLGAAPPKTSSGNNPSIPVKAASPGTGLPGENSAEASDTEKGINSSPHIVAVEKPVKRERGEPPASIKKAAPVNASPTKVSNPVPTSGLNSFDIPPKLIRSEKAIASLNDLRDFETGDVLIDAVIDNAGNVTSMRVLQGPPSLRWPALQALKNYKYEPALENGRPVPAHVTVKIKFHFE